MNPSPVIKAPDALLIVLAVLVLAIGLTWLVPAGRFERREVAGRTAVVPGTYQRVAAAPVPWYAVFTAPVRGFTDPDAALIIAFILLIGGAFGIVNATGAISAVIYWLARRAAADPRRRRLVIPLLMVAFSIAGNTFGMSEEVLVFIMITIPLARRMGWDAIVGTAIPFLGAGVGFAGAAFNPFTVGIAQGLSELPVFSGWPFRMAMWTVLTAIAIVYVMRYAARIERDPASSLLATEGREPQLAAHPTEEALTPSRVAVFSALGAGMVLLVVGVTRWGWYITEIAGMFIALGLVAAVVGRVGADGAAKAFTAGARDMVTPALIVALSKSVLLVMQEGRVVDTVLHALSSLAAGLPAALAAQVMLAVQLAINFFVPSGSGQAALTMPIMAPLADLLHIPRQAAVLAFQLGDGLSNFVIPTSAVTMGVLSIAGIPFVRWLRWVGWLMVWLAGAGAVFLALGTSVVRW